MSKLSKSQILLLHGQLIEQSGGIDGIRDEGLLDAALAAPFQSFDGQDVYSTTQQKAARLGYGLVKNHAFIDGNKRIGAHAMLIYLALNNIELDYTQRELWEMFLSIASDDAGYEELLSWIIAHQLCEW